MSVFEIAMLVCFGCAWPFSIYTSYSTRQNTGKNVVFLWIVLAGYAAGITHKVLYGRDAVIALYAINAAMVAADLCLFYRNARTSRSTT